MENPVELLARARDGLAAQAQSLLERELPLDPEWLEGTATAGERCDLLLEHVKRGAQLRAWVCADDSYPHVHVSLCDGSHEVILITQPEQPQ